MSHSTDTAGDSSTAQLVTAGRAWYTLATLTLFYTLAAADRQILALLVEPLKTDLSLSDTQFSLIGGFAFAILYALLGIPLGYLADYISRKKVVMAGLLAWTLLTALCGTARSFLQLLVFRVGVGAGEAGLGPAGSSVIADLFTLRTRGLAMGIFITGTTLGTAAALFVGGPLIAYLTEVGPVTVRFLGTVQPWQMVFFCFALPGILVAVLQLFSLEPPRQRPHESLQGDADASHWRKALDVFPYLWRHGRLYLATIGSFVMSGVMLHSILLWMPSYFIRSFGWSLERTGTSLGLMIVIFGTAGSLGGGLLLGVLEKNRVKVAAVKLGAIVFAVVTVNAELLFLMPASSASLVFVGFIVAGLWMVGPIMLTALIAITESNYIGRITAIALFGVNLIGMGVGPVLVALTTDLVFRDELRVGSSLAVVVLFAGILGIAMLISGSRHYHRATGAERA